MIIHTVWQKSFDFFGSKPVVVEPSAGQLSSDAGLLPIRQFDQRIGLTEQFVQALPRPTPLSLELHSWIFQVSLRCPMRLALMSASWRRDICLEKQSRALRERYLTRDIQVSGTPVPLVLPVFSNVFKRE